MPALIHSLGHLNHDVKLWKHNLQLSRGIRRQSVVTDGDFTFKPGENRYLKQIEALHLQVFREPLPRWLVWLYRFRARQLIGLALDGEDKVACYNLFMFQEVEYGEDIIHELYVAVAPQYQGQGLATKLRCYSLEAYDNGRLNGVSTLAHHTDIKALRSAQKAGYAITKESAKPPALYLYRQFMRKF
ncbi:MAG: GNAT family N-acetyltransferase [Succinivibrio sp.]|nr:GNAT family N-acetyltransferase [Succinivibrio sp.]